MKREPSQAGHYLYRTKSKKELRQVISLCKEAKLYGFKPSTIPLNSQMSYIGIGINLRLNYYVLYDDLLNYPTLRQITELRVSLLELILLLEQRIDENRPRSFV